VVTAALFTPSVAVAVAAFPRLTVEQFASLQVELAVKPRDRAEILARYQVTSEAGLSALEEAWGMLFAEKPEVRAAFDTAYEKFAAWLWGQRK